TTLTYTIVAQPAHGTLSGTAPNVSYTPAVNYNGADSFTFKANDGTVDSNVATVTITVTPVNSAPERADRAGSRAEDTAKPIVLAATDVDTATGLTYAIVAPPAHGTLTGMAPNVTYTPAPNYNGPDGFTFKANDGTVDSNVATVSITVAPVNDPPVAGNDTATTKKNTAVTINVLANDSDVDADALTVASVTQSANGTAAL